MIALSTNRLVLQAKAKLAESRKSLEDALAAPPRPGSTYRINEAREQVSYWQRKVQEMVSGG